VNDTILEFLSQLQNGPAKDTECTDLDQDKLETELGFAIIDEERAWRTGQPEVVFTEGKTPEQVVSILQKIVSSGHRALATRVDAEKAEVIQGIVPDAGYDPASRLLWFLPEGKQAFADISLGHVAVVSAGTSDLPVATEAAQCASWFGARTELITDVGVAGLHRLLSRLPAIRQADVVIAVAGMEGALASVLAGLVRAPVIAIPTSNGYGAHLNGLTTLLAMVNSCAGGLAVVNIDNGFGAAQMAARILEVKR